MNSILSGKYVLPFSVAAVVLVIGGVSVFSQMNQSPEPEPTPTGEDTSEWFIYRNDEFGFEVRYPQDYEVLGNGKPGDPIEGKETSPGYIFIRAKGDSWAEAPYIMISTPLTNDVSRNPEAARIEDYHSGYKAEYFDVIIHSQQEISINNNLMSLKQSYSAGEWKGNNVVDATSEYAENMYYRYIFVYDTGNFFILKNWNPAAKPNPSNADKALSLEFEKLLDSMAQTFKFIE